MPTSRPLSPHLQIYRWTYTMVLSVAHRATGLVLAAGAFLAVIWLVALMRGPESYDWVVRALRSAPGLLLVGDAFAFLDPVFSSGVFLALYSGEMGANFADACLTDGDYSASRFVDYGQDLCKSIESMRALVYAFYDHNFSFREYLKEFPNMKGDVTDCLIGNLLHDFQPMYDGMRKHAKLPDLLSHGAPYLEEAVALER